MSAPYAGQDPIAAPPVTAGAGTWDDITVPTDDDKIDAAALAVGLEGCADRDNWLAHHSVNGIDGGVYSGDVTLGTVTATQFRYTTPTVFNRSVESTPFPDLNSSVSFTVDPTDYWWITTVAQRDHLVIPLHLPNGAILNTITVHLKGPTGHAAFPGGKPLMPVVTVYKRVIATGAKTSLTGTGGTDATATVGAYQAAHAITLTLTSPYTCNRVTEQYFALLSTEGDNTGAGGEAPIAGTIFYGASVNYTLSVAASE